MKSGFTLAEVLITLGIIGVIAAMTLPALVASYREKETVARLKKTYSTLSNAYVSILDEYGPPPNWDAKNFDDVVVMFSKYINDIKICPRSEGGCFAHVHRKDLINNSVDNIVISASFVMNDGTVVGIGHQVDFDTALQCNDLNYCFHFIVDINGEKAPNQWGVDTFTFHVSQNRVIPRGAAGTHGRDRMCDPTASSTSPGWFNGSGCGAWVLQMENMDYLKCVKGNQAYCSKNYYFN